MSNNPDLYYLRSECSSSDLSELYKLLCPEIFDFDYSEALRFGTLVDALITEMRRVNVYKRTVDDTIYLQSDFDLARQMKAAFYRDPVCAAFMKLADCQKISIGMVKHVWQQFEFELEMRCKWDLFMPAMRQGADIKTTTATTQKQFEEACEHFNYWRSRVVYMKLENTCKDMLIGISKVNLKVFKIPIVKGDKYWQKGEEQANELAFNYWHLFNDFNIYDQA
jgi:PDDEXK-like domain of unknown function (DUF3799)